MLSYYVLYFEKFRKVIKLTEKEALITWLVGRHTFMFVLALLCMCESNHIALK